MPAAARSIHHQADPGRPGPRARSVDPQSPTPPWAETLTITRVCASSIRSRSEGGRSVEPDAVHSCPRRGARSHWAPARRRTRYASARVTHPPAVRADSVERAGGLVCVSLFKTTPASDEEGWLLAAPSVAGVQRAHAGTADDKMHVRRDRRSARANGFALKNRCPLWCGRRRQRTGSAVRARACCR
jgi:hypothetical protein